MENQTENFDKLGYSRLSNADVIMMLRPYMSHAELLSKQGKKILAGLIYMYRHNDTEESHVLYATHKNIWEVTGVSTRDLNKRIDELVNSGLVEYTRGKKGKTGVASSFRFLFDLSVKMKTNSENENNKTEMKTINENNKTEMKTINENNKTEMKTINENNKTEMKIENENNKVFEKNENNSQTPMNTGVSEDFLEKSENTIQYNIIQNNINIIYNKLQDIQERIDSIENSINSKFQILLELLKEEKEKIKKEKEETTEEKTQLHFDSLAELKQAYDTPGFSLSRLDEESLRLYKHWKGITKTTPGEDLVYSQDALHRSVAGEQRLLGGTKGTKGKKQQVSASDDNPSDGDNNTPTQPQAESASDAKSSTALPQDVEDAFRSELGERGSKVAYKQLRTQQVDKVLELATWIENKFSDDDAKVKECKHALNDWFESIKEASLQRDYIKSQLDPGKNKNLDYSAEQIASVVENTITEKFRNARNHKMAQRNAQRELAHELKGAEVA